MKASRTFQGFRFSDWVVVGLIGIAAVLAAIHVLFGLHAFFDVLAKPATTAWVQAIGAIGAIGIAIWVAHGAERAARENARVSAKHFVRMAEAAIGGLSVVTRICSEEADVQTTRFLSELKEVHLIGQSIPIGQLSSQLCDCVLEARILVARCHELGNDIRRRHRPRQHGLLLPEARDGFSIGYALISSSWSDIKELSQKAKTL